MDNQLYEQRLFAANCSAGTSSSSIKRLIVKIIKRHELGGIALDYGAGVGELLKMLERKSLFQKLAGADILQRPAQLDEKIAWYQQDLNKPLHVEGDLPNVVICSEVIEHLENPRATFRELYDILPPDGYLILTTPNQESIRSFVGLILGGHFTSFLGASYPAHITALLHLDLQRICEETHFSEPKFYYTNEGGIPKLPSLKWQRVSFGLLKGKLFSDNVALITQKK